MSATDGAVREHEFFPWRLGGNDIIGLDPLELYLVSGLFRLLLGTGG